jgi:hypothetical protein
MKYILIIYIIINPSTETEKNIEIKIPHETFESCMKASKKTEFKFNLPNFKFGSDSKCILNENIKESEIET